jgi:SRSO17 transposase
MGLTAGFVAEHLHVDTDPHAVVALDESDQEKKGKHTCGVKRQYVGCAGRVWATCSGCPARSPSR